MTYIENHDQIANSPFGRRLHQLAVPARLRALTALTLLGPATPMLFQGQEFAASAPFLFFADHKPELNESPYEKGARVSRAVSQPAGILKFVAALPSPSDAATFQRCKLDHCRARAARRGVRAAPRSASLCVETTRSSAVLGACVLTAPCSQPTRSCSDIKEGRTAIDSWSSISVATSICARLPEPLLAPPANSRWTLQWSSDAVRYGGEGTPPVLAHRDFTCRGVGDAAAFRAGSIDDDGKNASERREPAPCPR